MEEHMMKWIIEYVPESEWVVVGNRMLSLVRDYPDLINRSWPEIRTLSERV